MKYSVSCCVMFVSVVQGAGTVANKRWCNSAGVTVVAVSCEGDSDASQSSCVKLVELLPVLDT